MNAKTEADSLKVERMRAYASQCNGSENFYRHMLAKRLLYTDGVKKLSVICEAWWLVDAIASHMATNQRLMAEGFLTWTLLPEGEHGAKLVATDGNEGSPALASQLIGYTDFPRDLMPFKLFCEKGADVPGKPLVHTLMLPEER